MSSLLRSERLPAAVVIVLTIALIAWFTGPLGPDISGQFWLARAMLRGAHLYTDFVEINPPLWFWMAVPVEWVAQATGLRNQSLTVAVVGALVLVVVLASARLIRGYDRQAAVLLLTYIAALLLVMPMQHFEQREHLVLIGAVPYLFLAAGRQRRDNISATLAIGIGIGAGLGFALKPYFLAVPVLVEVWLAFSLRSGWRPLRPETIVVAMVCALYAGAIMVFTPEYLTVTIPLLLNGYEEAAPSILQSMDALPIIWACMLLWIAVQHRSIGLTQTPVTVAFLVGFLGFAFAYIVQHKGWLYQGVPATGCLAIALAALVLEAGRPLGLARLFLPALLVWPFAVPIAKTQLSIGPLNDIAPATRNLRAGDAFGLISISGATIWPSMVDRGLRSSSRHGQYWMLVSLGAHPQDPLIRQAVEQAVRETVKDYRCLPPRIIIFTIGDRDNPAAPPAYNPYQYFNRFAEFRALMNHYRLSERYGIFDVYQRVSMPEPIDPTQCRNPG